MPIPLWVLLAFAGWTLAILLGGVGLSRWNRILTGGAQLVDFPADRPHGPARYRRMMRAHANCVENLPVYGAIAVTAWVMGAAGPLLDGLALTLLGARVLQSLVHIVPEETNVSVAWRFVFFFVQVVCMIWMGALVATSG